MAAKGKPRPASFPFRKEQVTVHFLGLYLLLVFLLVFLLVGLWPPALPTPELAKADRLEAEKTFQDKTKALEAAETTSKSSAIRRFRPRGGTDAHPRIPKRRKMQVWRRPGQDSTAMPPLELVKRRTGLSTTWRRNG